MNFDIYGEPLRRGHCEVHPHVHEEYPCSVCVAERNAPVPGQCVGGCESEHYLGQAQEHIEHLNARIAELEARLKDPATVFVSMLRGDIAKPAFPDILSLYRDDALGAEANRLREELKAEQKKNADTLLRISQLEAQVRAAGAIPVKSFVVISEDEDVIEVPDADLGQALLMLEVARGEEPDKAWSLQAEVDADEARRLRGEALECPRCKGTGSVCTGTIEGVPELFDCDKCGGEGWLRAVPQAQGQGGEG